MIWVLAAGAAGVWACFFELRAYRLEQRHRAKWTSEAIKRFLLSFSDEEQWMPRPIDLATYIDRVIANLR